MADSIMLEDISIVGIENTPIKQLMIDYSTQDENSKGDEIQKYKCDVWFKGNISCKYESQAPSNMLDHIKSAHGDANKNAIDEKRNKIDTQTEKEVST